MTSRRVVITGLGIVTSCGNGWKPYWQSVLKRQSHVRDLPELSANGFPAKSAGYIADFDPAQFVKQRKLIKVMSREIQLAMAASNLALDDAGLGLTQEDPYRIGICIGTGIINNDLDEVGLGIRNALDEAGCFQMEKFGREGIRSLYPLWLLKYLPNMPACHISIAHNLRGPSNTITTSSAAGTQAIGEAFRVIKRGDADLMLAGGTDSKLNPIGISRFNLLGFLSFQNHVAEKAYCPFDERRDGVILGEGSGLLMLEELTHARKRGARIYGEVLGYGASSDFNYDPRLSEDITGKCLAMTRALEDASVSPAEIDFLLANGSGIPQEDINEACAIHSVFEHHVGQTRVTAVK
ncbi:MAG TPA: beta-ketoacyl-[acyl-carrier-protein] synthase family protein, partial [bacterium]|nr:beta-ketoacyl-[acyl-carrier-protein] synthase family protein [bacterium]